MVYIRIYKKNKDLKVDLTIEDMSFKKKGYIISNFGFIWMPQFILL